MEMLFSLKEEDINVGVKKNALKCPIALCMSRSFPNRVVFVTETKVYVATHVPAGMRAVLTLDKNGDLKEKLEIHAPLAEFRAEFKSSWRLVGNIPFDMSLWMYKFDRYESVAPVEFVVDMQLPELDSAGDAIAKIGHWKQDENPTQKS